MRKLIVLGFKEVLVRFRDLGALVTMLVTPLALTLAIAAAFGTGGSVVLEDIPVLVLNKDKGPMSQILVQALTSSELGDLLDTEVVTDEAAAKGRVEDDEVAVLVIVPDDLSQRMMPLLALAQDLGLVEDGDLMSDGELDVADQVELLPDQEAAFEAYFSGEREQGEPTAVILYASPQWRTSTLVVKAVVTQILEKLQMTTQGLEMSLSQAAFQAGDHLDQKTMLALGESMGGRLMGGQQSQPSKVTLDVTTIGRAFSWLDYSAASMAVLFLMFAATSGGRTLLSEREAGTLPRLLMMPIPAASVLVGKMGGVALTGVLQVCVLWGATSAIGAYWGNPLDVLVSIVALVICATGVGALIAAWSQTPQQAGSVGTAITLVGSAVSGSFFPRANLPMWLQKLSYVTPNSWGIEIFGKLQQGGGMADILPLLGWMGLITLAYYAIAFVGFRRQFR